MFKQCLVLAALVLSGPAWPENASANAVATGRYDYVIFEYEDIFERFDRSHSGQDDPASRRLLRKEKLARYAERKGAFKRFAASHGVETVDLFPEFPILALRAGQYQPRALLLGQPWVKSITPSQRMYPHLVQSTELVNQGWLRFAFPEHEGKLSGKGVSVMVIDTGADYRHKELGACQPGPKCKIVFAKDFTPADDGKPDTGSMHGTNVAAIAAGSKGLAREAKIISADVADASGAIYDYYVLDAIQWAIANRDKYKIAAINMSLGGGKFSSGDCRGSVYGPAVYEARRAGIVVVASAGNDSNANGMKEPACVPGVVSVGATFDGGPLPAELCPDAEKLADRVTCFSNVSSATKVLAPGALITAAGIAMSGTSQAAPHVAGAVALLRSLYPALTVAEVEARLSKTGIPIEDARNGKIYPRLDLIGLLEGDLQRPRPVPELQEWWQPAFADGKPLPILTDPWLVKDPIAERVLVDRATGLKWIKPRFLAPSGPVPLRTAQNACRRLAGGVYTYRVPTRHEMESIVDVRRNNPVIDANFFEGIVAGEYWTSSPALSNAGADNWILNTEDGRTYPVNPGNGLRSAHFMCVSAVRDDSITVHYADQGSAIRDHASGLVWQKNTVSAGDFQTLADACLQSPIPGRWRVPTWKELSTLVSTTHSQPYIDPLFDGDTALASSTPAMPATGTLFRGINFMNGRSDNGIFTSTRCVAQTLPGAYQPGRIFKGNVDIDGALYEQGNLALQDLESGHYQTIDGDLTIHRLNSAALMLPYLKKVTGKISISDSRIELIHLPSLAEVGADLSIVGHERLASISLPVLRSVGGSLAIESNKLLGRFQDDADNGTHASPLNLHSLETVGGAVDVRYNPLLKAFSLARLKSAGGRFFVIQNSRLWAFEARALERIGYGCKSSEYFCGSLSVDNNAMLIAGALSQLASVWGDFIVSGNPILDGIEQKIDRLGGAFLASGNGSLCARTRLDPILKRLWDHNRFPGKIEISFNSKDAVCKTQCPDQDHCSIPQ